MSLTIKDIAALAGVSRGTVDRVLHNRGRVAPEVKERIHSIIRECDYQPSRAAQQLSLKKRNLKIGFISRIDHSGFWSIVLGSVSKAERELHEYGIEVEKRFFEFCSPEIQLTMIDELVALGISALVIVPLDGEVIRSRLQELKDRGMPVILLNSEVTGFEPFCYIGSDYLVGGRTAAGLLHSFTGGRPLRILLLNGSRYLSTYVARRQGFLEELRAYGVEHSIIEAEDITMDPEYAYNRTMALMEEHPDIDAVYTVPDSAAAVSRVIRDRGLTGKIVHIGYGMTDATRPCILDGSMSAAIGQRAEQQGSLPFSILLDYFSAEIIPENRRILMLNDIFIRQNSVF